MTSPSTSTAETPRTAPSASTTPARQKRGPSWLLIAIVAVISILAVLALNGRISPDKTVPGPTDNGAPDLTPTQKLDRNRNP